MRAPLIETARRRNGRLVAGVLLSCSAWMGAALPLGTIVEASSPEASRGAHATQLPSSFAPLVDRIAGSVVSLRGTSRRSIVETIHGTGIVVNAGGFILTSDSVVRRGRLWIARLPDGRELPAKLLSRDQRSDLALLSVSAPGPLTPALLGDSRSHEAGDWVVAYGGGRGQSPALVKGTIAGRDKPRLSDRRPDLVLEMVVAGFAGAPVVDMNGHVIGIVSGRQGRDGGETTIGYALPVEAAREALQTLATRRIGEQSWLGVRLSRPAAGSDDAVLPGPEGALVNEVISDSPASRASILPGDRILELNGQEIASASALSTIVRSIPPRSEVDLVVEREQARIELHATLEPAPGQTSGRDDEETPSPGITYGQLTVDYAAQLSLPEEFTGIVISDITPGSTAWHAGLRLGDVVSEVNRRPARSDRDLRAALRAGSALLHIRRGETGFYTVLEGGAAGR